MAKLSIIVPVYNIEAYIERCLESIKNQSFKDFVCYVVNDGTKDNSANVAREFEKDKRFKVLDKENGGLSDARNFGLDYVKTPYVMFVDGDDFLELNCLEKAMDKIMQDDSDIVVFSYNQFYLSDGTKEIIHLGIENKVTSLKEDKTLLFKTPNAAWNKIYKTELFIKSGVRYPFGKRYEDLGTTPKLLYLANKISYFDEPLYNYIVDRPNNISTQIDAKLYHIFDMYKENIEFYKSKEVFEEYKCELDVLFERNTILTLRKIMSISDSKFVFEFIDFAFDYRKMYFGNTKQIYDVRNTNDDKVYLNKFLCKAYYLYRKVKHG